MPTDPIVTIRERSASGGGLAYHTDRRVRVLAATDDRIVGIEESVRRYPVAIPAMIEDLPCATQPREFARSLIVSF